MGDSKLVGPPAGLSWRCKIGEGTVEVMANRGACLLVSRTFELRFDGGFIQPPGASSAAARSAEVGLKYISRERYKFDSHKVWRVTFSEHRPFDTCSGGPQLLFFFRSNLRIHCAALDVRT